MPHDKSVSFEELKNCCAPFTVLYVEDDAGTAAIFQNILTRVFSQTYIAANGIDGLDVFHTFKPDLIIVDIVMPGMDGYEMMQRILEVRSDQPFVVTTAYNDPPYINRAVEMGCRGLIFKPIQRERFASVLFQVCKELPLYMDDHCPVKQDPYVSEPADVCHVSWEYEKESGASDEDKDKAE